MKLTDLDRNNWGDSPEYKADIEVCEGCGKEITGDDTNYEYGEPLCNECIAKRENEN